MIKFTKTALAILLSLCLCIGMIPVGMVTAAADVDEGSSNQSQLNAPQNVQVQLLSVETDENGKKWLVSEVSWDDEEAIKEFELYNSLKEAATGAKIDIPDRSAFTIGKYEDWPENFIVRSENGRCKITLKTPILGDGETKLETSQWSGEQYCNGIEQGDTFIVDLQSAGQSESGQWLMSELSKPVEVVYTEENVKNKKTFTAAVDDKTVAPPAEVVLPYTGQPQACPYTDQAGYYVMLNNPETDAGIYTAALILRDGYKWTDGSTDGKPAIWAIDKAPITSVTLQNSELTYNSQEQHPVIASVTAGTLTVPAEGYTVSYSETPLYAGKYTLTVKGKGNFTGSASAEFEIFTVTSDTCNHVDYLWKYEDNKDGKTHKVFCTNCGGCLNNSEAHQIVYDAFHTEEGEYLGAYNPRCVHCGYEGNTVFCKHTDELEYTNNGLGTHKVTCKRCKKVVTEKEQHSLVTTPITSDVGGYQLYNGQYTISCEKCDYCAEFTCDHKGTDRVDYVPDKSVYPNFTHVPHCAKCLKLLLDEPENCVSDGNYTPESINYHASHCTVCGQKASELHNCTGTRKITAIGKTPYKGGQFNLFTRYVYHIYYTETCKDCGALRMGDFNYWDMPVERWLNYDDAFKEIMSKNPDELVNMADTSQFLHTGKYLMLIPATLLSSIYEATGTNTGDCCTLNMNIILSYKGDSEDQNGSCALYDKDGKLIQSYRTNKDPNAPVGSNGDEGEGVLEDDLGKVNFTNDDGACVAVSTDVLMTLPDGENSFTTFFTTGDGQQVAVTMLFTIFTTDDGQKGIKDLHPQGTMINADGDVVSMNLSKDTLIYTGEALELPAVTLTNEMGVEYAEDEDYTLTYYQVVEGVDGELTEVEVDREQISEIGTYNIVANPTRNGVLSGSAWAQFHVVEVPLVTIGDLNGDGVSDVLDAAEVQKYAAGKVELNKQQLLAGDVNNDGNVDVLDAAMIQKYAAGKITEFPQKA